MLDTLLKIGEWRNKGVSLLQTKLMDVEPESETPLVLPIVIDLDNDEIYYDTENIMEFDPDNTPEEIMLLNTFSANSHKTYLAIDTDHLYYLEEALFGKEGKGIGDFQKHIDSNFSRLKKTQFYEILTKAFSLSYYRDRFDSENLKEYESADSKIAVAYLKAQDSSSGISETHPMFEIKGFKEFRDKKYFNSNTIRGNCYVTNETRDDVIVMSVDDRKRTLKMFQGTALNYVSDYDKNNLAKNFRVSEEILTFLKAGDEFVRKNLRVSIAGIPHLIIPKFPSWKDIDIELAIKKITDQNDLLFSSDTAKEMFKNYELWSEEIYWVNYIAIDSDGQSFKTLNEIQDVSEPYLNKVIEVFREVDWQFKSLSKIVDWQKVKKNYRNEGFFNLKSIYELIPIRQDNDKIVVNNALQLFKSILEQRKLEKQNLFQFFSELMLCHYYDRYKSYLNVRDYSQKGNKNRSDYFVWAIRDSVFKYLAFIQVLKKLNLIDMEKTKSNKDDNLNFGDRIENFFTKMGYNEDQKALFYLGRMLNDVHRLQKGKSQTVVDKVNYNGMDKNDIQRLSTDLFEKKLQYKNSDNKSALKSFDFNHGYFKQLFDYNHWLKKDITEEEAVFFILTGYSFGIVKQKDSNSKNN